MMDRVAALVNAKVDAVGLDTAHGHSAGVLTAVETIKKAYPDLPLIAGNVATAHATHDLIMAGADVVKVGIGPGSICHHPCGRRHRRAADHRHHGLRRGGRPLRQDHHRDGGVKYSGDIPKAIAAGASAVMLGSLFAGTEESPGAKEIYQGRSFKVYRGMGSLAAMAEGSKDRYSRRTPRSSCPRASRAACPTRGRWRTPFSSSWAACAPRWVTAVRRYTVPAREREFIRITNAGLVESHPHDSTSPRKPRTTPAWVDTFPKRVALRHAALLA